MRKLSFSTAACEPALLLIFPKHFFFGRLWITCTHPCLNCSNMLEVDQTERLSARTADRAAPVGCWGSDMKTRKEQRLVGTVKDAWTIAAHQNSFSETGMNTRRMQEPLKHVKTPLLSVGKCGVKTGGYLHLKPLLHLLSAHLKHRAITCFHKHNQFNRFVYLHGETTCRVKEAACSLLTNSCTLITMLLPTSSIKSCHLSS